MTCRHDIEGPASRLCFDGETVQDGTRGRDGVRGRYGLKVVLDGEAVHGHIIPCDHHAHPARVAAAAARTVPLPANPGVMRSGDKGIRGEARGPSTRQSRGEGTASRTTQMSKRQCFPVCMRSKLKTTTGCMTTTMTITRGMRSDLCTAYV